MHKQSIAPNPRTHSSLKALCALSQARDPVSPRKISRLIYHAPDPATAVRAVLEQLPAHSEVLTRKWRQLVVDLWSQHHPHIPVLLDLPITTSDVAEVPSVQDTLALLRLISDRPAAIAREGSEWLLAPEDAYHLATNLPSLKHRPLIQLENEWQCLPLRRLRTTVQALRLLRRHGRELSLVKARYQRFIALPVIQQYYLLWHTEAYHVNWAPFAGIWGDYMTVVQECLPMLWDMSEGALPDIPYDIRQWNQDMWDTFAPLWAQEGLLQRQGGDSALLTFVRTHSLPTAVTQVVMRDLFERYGLIIGEGEFYLWTTLGSELLAAERTQELPCALDLLK
ncbi:MAG: hypothetical protein HY372_03865 [Candidatus Andersenbacteria bacterium]|nr:hypothetical protein [Candidatus Andersenbacteria bacterium]